MQLKVSMFFYFKVFLRQGKQEPWTCHLRVLFIVAYLFVLENFHVKNRERMFPFIVRVLLNKNIVWDAISVFGSLKIATSILSSAHV